LPGIQRHWVRVRLNKHQRSERLLGLAGLGVVTVSVMIVTVGVVRVIYVVPQHAWIAITATVFYLPFLVWHIWRALHRRRPAMWGLVVMIPIVVSVLPVIGVQWLGALYALAASVLLTIRSPWSLLVFAALAVVPIPVAYAFGEPAWSMYFAFGVVINGLTIALPVWLIAAVRELRATRSRLADEAVVRERLRVDAELRDTLGAALESIAGTGDQAAGLAVRSPAMAAEHLHDVVDAARTTLARARRMVARFSGTPVRDELDAAVALLGAAGIEARLVLPPGPLPDSEELAKSLREAVSRLLTDETVRQCVIKVGPAAVEVVER
jgi:two-component system, NarL family, sensor histidine kinase DesK